jgi:aminopeptidase N
MQYAQGVEYPGIVLIASDLYAKPDEPGFIVAIAHETAHQWWYNVVGDDVFDSPWLDEALTTYSSSLYEEFALGPAYANGLLNYWQQRYAKLVQDGNDDQVTASLAHFERLNNPAVYSGVVYVKGALFFQALRQEIGDQAFFSALQQYYQNEQFQIATPQDLLAAFEQASGRNLQDFYQQWLYSPQPK